MKNKSFIYLFFLSAAVLSFLILLNLLLPRFVWINEPVHSSVEAFGSLAAILLSIMLLHRQHEEGRGRLFWMANGLLSMGLFDGLHSVAKLGHGFILLHSVACFLGGFWFALVWLPESNRYSRIKKWIPYFVAAGSVLFGVWTLLFRETMPLMVENGKFTNAALLLNIFAGVFFLIATGRFLLDLHRSGEREFFLFSCMALLLGLANLFFPLSAVWDNIWWSWHLLRVLAFLLALWFVLNSDLQTISALNSSIAGRERIEETLRKSEERYRTILEISNDLIWELDKEGNFTFFNKKAEDVSGYRLDEWLGKSFAPLIPPSDLPRIEKIFIETKSGKTQQYEVNVLRKDGSIFALSVNSAPIIKSGEVVGSVSFGQDITERLKLETQYRQAQKMESIGTLAGGIAHDFNNILSAIIGYGHMAIMKLEKDDPQRLNIENMLEAADRAAHLTKDLLLFSRKQMGEQKPVDLNDIIRKVEKFLRRVIGEDIECRTMLHDRPLTVLADSHQLEQVFMNFATNARDAMPKGGVFTIAAEQIALEEKFASAHGFGAPGNYAMITVTDIGIGMDEETRQRIFDPFFTTKEVGMGTGLGLAVVFGIIEQHNGHIDVSSEPGKGTMFRIYLPLISTILTEEKKEPDAVPLQRGTETILLAEDDKALRILSTTVLREFGYDVIEAVDGADAVKKFMDNRDRIHLLLFDIIMPKMSGSDAYDRIIKIKPDVKAIFVSGHSPETIRQKVMLNNRVSMIFKPVLPSNLLKKVRSVLDEKPA